MSHDTIDLTPADYGLNCAVYDRAETKQHIKAGNTKLHQLINKGELNPFKEGRKTLFTALEIAAYINRRRRSSATP